MSVATRQLITRAEGDRRSYPVAASTYLYEGTLAYLNASGYLDDDTANGANKFAGVVVRDVDNSSGSNGSLSCEVFVEGDFKLVGSGFSQASVGLDAFGDDNYTVAAADGAASVRLGTIVGYDSSTVVTVAIETENYSQGAALTTQLTTLTHTAPTTPDYAIQNLTATTPFGFVTADEGNSVLKVVANLQVRLAEVESRLKAAGLLA